MMKLQLMLTSPTMMAMGVPFISLKTRLFLGTSAASLAVPDAASGTTSPSTLIVPSATGPAATTTALLSVPVAASTTLTVAAAASTTSPAVGTAPTTIVATTSDPVDPTSADKDPASAEEKKKPGRIQQKRLVGWPATSIKQMKDSIVRAQAVITANKVETVMAMTRYKSWEQKNNLPSNETYLLNFDNIVHRPDLVNDGERTRKPVWTVMMPDDIDAVSFGEELVKLGQAIQDPKLSSKKRAKEWGLVLCTTAEEYLESIYGKKIKKPKKNQGN